MRMVAPPILKDNRAAVGLIGYIIALIGGMVGLYMGWILIGQLSGVFTTIYSGNNSAITNGINQTTNIVTACLTIFSVGLLAWGGFGILNWFRGE